MNKITLCALLGVVLLATGCPKYRPKVDFDNKNSFQGKLNGHLANEQKRYQCFRDGMSYTDGDPPTCMGTVTDGPARAKAVRDALITDALSYVDDAYGDFKNDLAAGRDRINFGADLIELGTSAAVGITKGERPLQILGIALTAFRGGRRSADVNFYKDQSTPILISKMNGNRAKVRALILENQQKDIDAYPIGSAISDIVDYYNAGSLVDAFTELQKDTALLTKQSEDDLRALKKRAGITLLPTEEELRIVRENANAIDRLADAYVEAADRFDDAEGKITTATKAIDDATKASADAAKRAADAGARAEAERAKAKPDQAVIKEAEAAKKVAEADKTLADANKTKAEADKKVAEADKTAAATAMDTALDNLRGTYAALEIDPALSPLLDRIPESDPKFTPEGKAKLQAALRRLKEKTPAATKDEKEQRASDYALIMFQLGKIVRMNLSKDPTLNQRLQTILKVNQ